jgi:hypothetical protein
MTLNCIEKNVFEEREFLNFLIDQGIIVKTNTRARGNLGICYKNRIDISKKVIKERRIPVLAHEYAHKIHYDLEKNSFSKGGSLERLFDTENVSEIQQELITVTHFVDEKSKFIEFICQKSQIYLEIKELETVIKKEYSDFKRSKEFKPAKKYLKDSPAKYLLRYDNIKIVHPIFRKENVYSIKTIDEDFPDMPESIKNYLRLKSCERRYKRLYRAKSKAEKYYNKSTELFARFIEGLFIDKEKVAEIAPFTYSRFNVLLNNNYYGKLKELFALAGLNIC